MFTADLFQLSSLFCWYLKDVMKLPAVNLGFEGLFQESKFDSREL